MADHDTHDHTGVPGVGGSSDLDAIITASAGQDIADALAGAAAPDSGNVFATMADVGGGGVVDTAMVKRVSGNITVNGTSWANLDTGLDLTVSATTGDILMFNVNGLWGNEAVSGTIDAASIVSAAIVNRISGNSGASDFGPAGWMGLNGTYNPIGGTYYYVVQAGDIDAGSATFRLRVRTDTATNKTFFGGGSDIDFQWSIVNIG